VHALASAHDALARAKAAGADRVLVALSGGKDSLVSLDLAAQAFGARNVVAFFMYLVPDLHCEQGPVRAAARRYGIELVTVPHWDLGRMLKYAVLRTHINGTDKWRDIKLGDVELLVRHKTGIRWIVYGHRADESLERRGMLKDVDGCDVERARVYPLRWWKGRDSYAYLRQKRIPVPSMFGGTRNAGISLAPNVLRYLRDHHPSDYAKVIEMFPFAEAVLFRDEAYGLSEKKKGHGHTANAVVSPTYRSWAAMLQRCYNPKHVGYARYGGRGITVCERWRDSFEAFVADMGERPSRDHSIERTDGDKPYEPTNCTWATKKAQQRNRAVVKVIEHNGRAQAIAAWAEEAGLATNVLANRIARGWDMERALTTPVASTEE
jgi:phosphoadenosine phosphosulfate reductase